MFDFTLYKLDSELAEAVVRICRGEDCEEGQFLNSQIKAEDFYRHA